MNALVSTLRDKIGYPYTVIPAKMLQWNRGGGRGWGGTCGAIISACTAANMVTPHDVANKMTLDIFGWYESTPLPTDITQQLAHQKKFPVEEYESTEIFHQTIANSPLCHISMTRWCKKVGYASGSKERSEHCARVSADTAVLVTHMLNDWADNKFKEAYAISAAAQECRSCHRKGASFEEGGWTRGKMDCSVCHDVAPDHFEN